MTGYSTLSGFSTAELTAYVLMWAIFGALPGFYLFYANNRNPRTGASIGVIVGVALGWMLAAFDTQLEISTLSSTVIILWLTALLLAFILPRGDHKRLVSLQQSIADLAYGLLLPTFILVFAIVIFPMIWNLVFSLRPIRMRDLQAVDIFSLDGLGLRNFERVFATRGGQFWHIMGTTFFYTFSGSLLAIFLGLVAALVAKDAFPGRGIFRGFMLFPYIAPVISLAFIWDMILNSRFGLANEVISALGGTRIDFLTTKGWALLMIILFQGWRYFPFAFLFILARIQAIPEDMYEAAKVDGAAPSERLWYITLPQLRAVFGTLFLLRFIWTFNKFDDVFLLTGGVADTEVIPVQIYNWLFSRQNVGTASATAVVMAAILFVVVAVYFRWFMVTEEV